VVYPTRVELIGAEITNELDELMTQWRNEAAFKCLAGWRNERFRVYGTGCVLFEIERAAVSLLGVRSYGCHINGYTDSGHMWVQRRSKTKQTWPGYLGPMLTQTTS
jgi:hypothetical protein